MFTHVCHGFVKNIPATGVTPCHVLNGLGLSSQLHRVPTVTPGLQRRNKQGNKQGEMNLLELKARWGIHGSGCSASTVCKILLAVLCLLYRGWP